MRTMLPFLVFLCCAAGVAVAGPNQAGTITLHWNSAVVSTPEDPAWIDGGVTDCESSVTQAPAATSFPNPPYDERRIWFVYAAFPPGTSPRLKAISFGLDYQPFVTPEGVRIDGELSPPGATEIMTTNPPWPAPNSGVTIAFGTTMTGLMNEIYMFEGYGSLGQIFSLRTHPTHPSQFADDAVPAHLDGIADYGTLGFGVDGRRACPGTPTGACCNLEAVTCELLTAEECDQQAYPHAWQGPFTTCDPNPCPFPRGACCFTDGTCQILTEPNCADARGAWLGPLADCSPNLCPQPGACCYPDGSCQFMLQEQCSTGDWRANVTCSPNPCPQPPGACCFEDGTCQFVTGLECSNLGGAWRGHGTTCDPNPCPQPGACCGLDGSCVFVLQAQCHTADFRPGVSCDPNPCPQPGACCSPDGTCEFVLQNRCGTDDWRAGVVCDPNPCPQPEGACCLPDGSCQFVTEVNCAGLGGFWAGFPTSCDPNPCPQLGACCGLDGTCAFILSSECPGDFFTGVACDPNPCPQPGACCEPDGTCEFVPENHCGTDDWRPEAVCDPNPCPQPSGACCFPDHQCELTLQADCATGDWRMFVPCDPNPCVPESGACCYADGHCVSVLHDECSGGAWFPGVPCVPNPCPQPGPCNPEPRRLVGPGATVDAIARDLGNHAPRIDKGSYLGDNMGDTREGGEDFSSACVISSLPFSDAGATCDNADNITLPCAASAAPDVVYSYLPASSGSINVNLCGSGYDTALGIYDQNQVNIACNDDFCGLQSEIDNVPVTAGQVVYIVVDGFSTNCGSYVISVTEDSPPPPLECPAGAQLEGEPDCYDGYLDTTNGGCNSPTYRFTIICPQDGNHAVLCGKSGTYLYRGVSYRDTDWFRLESCGGQVCATWTATFPIQAILIYGPDCDNLLYDLATGGPGQPVTLCRNITGEFWLWAAPSQFNAIPCGSDYLIDVTGICSLPGCEANPIETKSWGRIKYLFK